MIATRPTMWRAGGSVTIARSAGAPMIQARNTLAMTNDSAKKIACLTPAPPHLVARPRAAVAPELLLGRAFDQVLELAEQHLHEDGLRAQPAAPDAADDDRR